MTAATLFDPDEWCGACIRTWMAARIRSERARCECGRWHWPDVDEEIPRLKEMLFRRMNVIAEFLMVFEGKSGSLQPSSMGGEELDVFERMDEAWIRARHFDGTMREIEALASEPDGQAALFVILSLYLAMGSKKRSDTVKRFGNDTDGEAIWIALMLRPELVGELGKIGRPNIVKMREIERFGIVAHHEALRAYARAIAKARESRFSSARIQLLPIVENINRRAALVEASLK